jgi:cyclic pyranopterin monophosphate synthase
MRTRFSYAFEELTQELNRPPKAAMRAMFSAGIMLSPKGWQSLTVDTRQALAVAGLHEKINESMVRQLLNEAGPTHMKMVPKIQDPPRDDLPKGLLAALGLMRTITVEEWRGLTPLDRFVLDSLSHNTRLLWRAIEEIARQPDSPLRRMPTKPWSGALARCEVFIRPEARQLLLSSKFLGGRATLLARAAGVRAARRAGRFFDLQAEVATGPTELDWAMGRTTGVMLWQAHVSTWDAEFFPAASLLAVTTAAVAVYDMIKEVDPQAFINGAGIAEERWKVGTTEDREEATAVYRGVV